MKDVDTLLQQTNITIATRNKDRLGQARVDATRTKEQKAERKGGGAITK